MFKPGITLAKKKHRFFENTDKIFEEEKKKKLKKPEIFHEDVKLRFELDGMIFDYYFFFFCERPGLRQNTHFEPIFLFYFFKVFYENIVFFYSVSKCCFFTT